MVKRLGIHKGLELGGYNLINISTRHVAKVIYREYEYPTVLTWERVYEDADVDELYGELIHYLGHEKTIRTSYGNSYNCIFQSSDE
jgi:hypothetical protein